MAQTGPYKQVPAESSLRSAPQERSSTGAMRTDAMPCSALPFSQGVEREHSAEHGISAHSKDSDFQKFFRLRRNQFCENLRFGTPPMLDRWRQVKTGNLRRCEQRII